ncbi:MAG TPA: hypothetical protein VKV40_00695 [Ktedonobacteraceae bacterium]|nr:hypothetical protein [Ktedonobacteraceae bacterium]
MLEEGQSLNNGNNQQAAVPSSAATGSAIDIEALAEKVYRLMREQARLERVRGEKPGHGRGIGR